MFHDDEQLLQLGRDRNHGGQDDTNVLFVLPELTCWARAWTISADCMKRWKLTMTNNAELSAEASAFSDRMAASGSLPPASAVWLFAWPGRCKPRSISQTASRQSFVAAHLGDLGQGVVVLVGLDPQAGETGGDVLREMLFE